MSNIITVRIINNELFTSIVKDGDYAQTRKYIRPNRIGTIGNNYSDFPVPELDKLQIDPTGAYLVSKTQSESSMKKQLLSYAISKQEAVLKEIETDLQELKSQI